MRFSKYRRPKTTSTACALAVTSLFLPAGFFASLPVFGQTPAAPPSLTLPTQSAPSPLQPGPSIPSFMNDLPSAVAPVPTPPAPLESDNEPTGRILSINIVGNNNITTDAIKANMTQKVGDPYNPDLAEDDRLKIKGMGLFNGDVNMTATQDGAGVDLTYSVSENPVIKNIVFTANTPNHEPTIPSKTLLAQMQTRPGNVLNTNTLTLDLDKLFSRQTGYARAQGYLMDVSADINIDPLTGTLTIPLVEAHIQSIEVTGNKKTKPVVILREIHEKPGDVLDERRLQRDLTKVFNLGLFESVGPFDEIPTDVGQVVISIPVKEKRSGTVSVGVGYSSTAKLVGRAELAENNFRGLGERVSLMWEVGGVNNASSLDVGYIEPYLDKYHTSLSVDVFDKAVYRFASSTFGGGALGVPTTGTTGQYTEQHKGGVVSVGRPLSETLHANLSLRTETVTSNNFAVPANETFILQDGNVTALGAGLSNNTRDNDINPASGAFDSASYELGGATTTTVNNTATPLDPGFHAFGKLGFDFRRYISLQGTRKQGDFKTPKKVLAVRLLLGATNHEVPFYEQYFLGGADSLRGYDQDRFYGSNLTMVQSEFRIPVGKDNNFQVVVLTDLGDAWGSIYQGATLDQSVGFKLQGDYGLGIRLVTPIGPIRLDYGIPITGGGGRTQFSIGQSF